MIGDEVSFKTGVKWWRRWRVWKIGSLIEGVFGRSTSTEIKAFYRLIWLDGTTFVLPCFLTLIQTICRKSLAITLPKNGNGNGNGKSTSGWLASLKNVVAWAPNEGAEWRLSSSVAVPDSREGPKGGPPLFSDHEKKNFWGPPPPPPPYLRVWMTGPPTPYLKVWIRHYVVWTDGGAIRFHIRIYVNGASVI